MLPAAFPIPLAVWAELVRKAQREGIVLTPIKRARRLMRATSSSRPGITYEVNDRSCTCPAGAHKKPCKHKALWLYEHIDDFADQLAASLVAPADPGKEVKDVA